uniref:Large ribosomal subunit protein mL44 n=1 Tax=Glossina morsitans morsitans TaxID=37546 RepID=D3TMI2_GLOMM
MALLRNALRCMQISSVKNVGSTLVQTRSFKRWVAPVLRELRHRAKKLGPQPPAPRSGFLDWNYRAELFAFGKRLNEDFQIPLLQTALIQESYVAKEKLKQEELGVENVYIQLKHNAELAEHGQRLAKAYIEAFVAHSLPKMPAEGHKAVTSYLLTVDTLSHVALHLGMKELLMDADYPPSSEAMSRSLLAVIGCLQQSSGLERAFSFVRDFICTQLNQKDLMEIWHIDKPEEVLRQICREGGLSEPEPRWIADCGRIIFLAAYLVGRFSIKKLLGKGLGEDINPAIQLAARDALQIILEIQELRKLINFGMEVESKSIKLPLLWN